MKTPHKMTMDQIRKGLRLAIEESVADKYEAFRDSIQKWWLDRAADFVANHKGKAWYDATHGQRGEPNKFLIAISPGLRKLVDEVAGDRHGSVIGNLFPNAKQMAFDIATEEANTARDHFINKNTMKLENIIQNKSLYGVDGVEVTPIHVTAANTFEGSIELKFSDGMRFAVKNKLVYKISPLGTPFFQYPTTFHGVMIPGQKTRSMVPEDEMLEIADPDNIGKRISKAEEIDQEAKQVRRDEREAKKDVKRQKALLRYVYEAVMPDGTRTRTDPTDRALTVAVAQKDANYAWTVWSNDWYTDRKKAEAKVNKFIRDTGELHASDPTRYIDPNKRQYAYLDVRKLPHPEHVGEVGGEVEVLVMVDSSYQTHSGIWVRAHDANENKFIWLDNVKYQPGTALEITGVIEKHSETDKYEKYNELIDVSVKQ